MRKINYIVVHCTATAPSATLKSIQNYWKTTLGWKSPGYHYVIENDGHVNILAPHDKICNGVAGHNSNSIHISYIGGVEGAKAKDTRSVAQIEKMVELLKVLHAQYPNAKIVGHRDLSPDKNKDGKLTPNEWIKQCPSFDVAQWLQSINFFK